MMGYGHGYGYGNGWTYLVFGGLLAIVVIAVVIYVFTRAGNNSLRLGHPAPTEMRQETSSRALEILTERYARGEISDEEYRQKKAEINKP